MSEPSEKALEPLKAFLQTLIESVRQNKCHKCGRQPANTRGAIAVDEHVYCFDCSHGLLRRRDEAQDAATSKG